MVNHANKILAECIISIMMVQLDKLECGLKILI